MTVLLFLDFHPAENTGADESAEKLRKKLKKALDKPDEIC